MQANIQIQIDPSSLLIMAFNELLIWVVSRAFIVSSLNAVQLCKFEIALLRIPQTVEPCVDMRDREWLNQDWTKAKRRVIEGETKKKEAMENLSI